MRIIFAGSKPWSRAGFEEAKEHLSGFQCSFVATPEELETEISSLQSVATRVFVLHWNWIIPKEVLDQAVFVCFHMTDLPFGRGGSPLQNLITAGFSETKLTAFLMDAEIDTGPVVMKSDLSLKGSAAEIYLRQTRLSYSMAKFIAANTILPRPQEGEVVKFRRRSPAMSNISDARSASELFDRIRMVDAATYPRAFIEEGGYQVEFSDAKLEDGILTCTSTFVFKTTGVK